MYLNSGEGYQNYKVVLPSILGFMRSNYGKQVVVLKEITACSITETDNILVHMN
jgi:hypothetical protein